LYAPKNQNRAEIPLCSYLVAPGQAGSYKCSDGEAPMQNQVEQ